MDYSINIQTLLQIEKRKWLLLVGLLALAHLLCLSLMLPHGNSLLSIAPNNVVESSEDLPSLQASIIENPPEDTSSSPVQRLKNTKIYHVDDKEEKMNSDLDEDGMEVDDDVNFVEDVTLGDANVDVAGDVFVMQSDEPVEHGSVDKKGESESIRTAKETLLIESVVQKKSEISESEVNVMMGKSIAASNNGSSVSIKAVKKKMRCDIPPKTVTSIEEMEQLLARHRARSRAMRPRWSSERDKEILSAKLKIESAPILKNDRELYAPLYRNVSKFKRSYELMERLLKIYVYKEGEKPIFHQPILKGLYASEGWFMKLMEGNKHFVVKDPRKAHLFYMPFSSRMLEFSLYVRNSHNRTNLRQYLKDYSEKIAAKYRFWNRTGGADHFLVACHDWAPYETRHHMQDNKSKVNTPPLNTDGIHACAESGNLTAFQRLLHQNPHLLNEKSILMTQTPLHIAAGLNRVEIVKYLLEWRGLGNVELEAKNVYGETPLHAAAKNGCNESVRMLLDYRANVEAKTNDSMTPLQLAIGFALQSGDNSTIKILSEFNADSSVKDDEGMTSLNYLPAGTQNEELVKPLYGNVASQMNIFTQQEGMTSLNYLPASTQNDELMKLLYGNVPSQMNIFTPQESMASLNYLPASTQNDELIKLLYGNVASQMNIFTPQVNSFTQQIYNPTGYNLNGLQPTNYSSTNNDCSSSAGNQNVDSGENVKMKEFDEELSKIVGLQSLKQQLRKWAKGIILDEKRLAMGLNLGSRKSPHMAFLGNPGTGKTSVARILGRLMHSVGVLSTDKVTEVQRTDLIAEYIGQTGPKTRKKIEEAMGGILFIDEAYRLAPKQSAGSHVDFGVEALEEIMSFLEDGNLVVVFAGYTDKMKAVFSTNEGFCRRVNHFFEFDDYSSRDLAEMLMIKMSKQDEKSRLCGFKLHPSCTFDAVLALIERGSTKTLRGKMNGGLVDNMLNNARECLDLRLTFNSSGDELLTITLGDLENGLKQIAKRENVC